MARQKLPIAIARLTGAAAANPQRYRAIPPKADGELGDPPPHLSPCVAAVWREIAGTAPAGVLAAADRFAVELAANLVAEYRKDSRSFLASRIAQMIGLLARLGLTPVDRQRLAIEPAKSEENPFDSF
jgi:phage terminase small subunit